MSRAARRTGTMEGVSPDPVPTPELLVRVERLRAMTAERVHPLADAVECPDCLDRRWVDRGSTLIPCRSCNPVSFRRWQEGHYREGHAGCEECSMVARGEMKVGRDVDPVTGAIRPGVLGDP